MNVTEYLASISNFDLLTKEQEIELFQEVAKGNSYARELAIVSNLRLVVSIAKKYAHTKIPLPDIIQAGNTGLIRAVDKFDISKESRFSTYGTFWIKQSILHFLNTSKSSIRYPSYVLDLINKVSKLRQKYVLKSGKAPSLREIAKDLDISLNEAKRIDTLMSIHHVSLEEQHDNGALICGIESSTDEIMCERFSREKVLAMVQSLKDKEKRVVVHRFGLFGNRRLTLEEVAQKMNITRERVRQIQKSVVTKLRERATRI